MFLTVVSSSESNQEGTSLAMSNVIHISVQIGWYGFILTIGPLTTPIFQTGVGSVLWNYFQFKAPSLALNRIVWFLWSILLFNTLDFYQLEILSTQSLKFYDWVFLKLGTEQTNIIQYGIFKEPCGPTLFREFEKKKMFLLHWNHWLDWSINCLSS